MALTVSRHGAPFADPKRRRPRERCRRAPRRSAVRTAC